MPVDDLFALHSASHATTIRRLMEVDEKQYAGLTLNERLFVSGNMDAFDQAAAERDRNRMVLLLEEVGLTLANPGRYGF